MRRTPAVAASAVLVALAGATPASAAVTVDLVAVGTYASSSGAVLAGAEIITFDPATKTAFTTNGVANRIDRADLTVPSAPVALTPIELAAYGTDVQSVAVKNGVLAAAMKGLGANATQAPGKVVLFNASTGAFLREATVGALPDNVAFTPDGTKVLTADEGEPRCDTTGPVFVNPEGSVSIVTVATGAVQTATFTAFNGTEATLRAAGVRLNLVAPTTAVTPSTVAQDLEPEYVAVSADGATAFVTLQENNALAVVDVATATVTAIKALPAIDHSLPGKGLDPTDRDNVGGTAGVIAIGNRPISGMAMPDGIARLTQGATSYLLTANEGDARDYGTCFAADDPRLSTRTLDPSLPAALKASGPGSSGRLGVSRTDGDTDGDGDLDKVFALGSRGMYVLAADGSFLADTGDQVEQAMAARFPTAFNADSSTATVADDRSDNKGPEAESVVTGRVGTTDLAFLGLERFGGIAVFDMTTPTAPALVELASPRVEGGIGSTDRAPEGLVFVPAADSPTGVPLLLVSNENTGTNTVYEVRAADAPTPVVPEVPVTLLLPLAAVAVGGAVLVRRRRSATV